MYLPRNVSKERLREAQHTRDNRTEIATALTQGQITRRDLVKWGIYTAGGLIAAKSGLSPFAKSAFAKGSDVPTGTPPTPMFGVKPFTQPMPRLLLQQPKPMRQGITPFSDADAVFHGKVECSFPATMGEPYPARWASYHTEYDEYLGSGSNPYVNPVTGRGPCEGRPPGEYYAHQRWGEYTPRVAYRMCVAEVEPGIGFHPGLPAQSNSDGTLGMNAIWSYGDQGLGGRGTLPPPLIKARYGEPFLARIYNNTPLDPTQNGGFGRNETNIHFHNAHNGSESDGANNAHFFPGTFFDYHWSTTMARADESPARFITE